MDINDNLSSLEQRLADWRPSTDGLDPDRMLFAAGQASIRPIGVRFTWPVIAAGFAVLAMVFGYQLTVERSARLILAQQLQRVPPDSDAQLARPNLPSVDAPLREIMPSPSSYLASHRALEQGLDAWSAPVAVLPTRGDAPVSSTSPLRLWTPDRSSIP